jgi:hypothetical protein
MEKFSHFRDRGRSRLRLAEGAVSEADGSDRLWDRALPPHSHSAFRLPAPAARIPLLLPTTAPHNVLSGLFSGATMAPHRIPGEESVAMVYIGDPEPVVD